MEKGDHVMDIVLRRYSCRAYTSDAIAQDRLDKLGREFDRLQKGPFGTRARLSIIKCHDVSPKETQGLGTYGKIKNPAAFLAGVVEKSARDLEDFGYLMEKAVLQATSLGIASCWLGVTFKKSVFIKRLCRQHNESVPAVAAMGYPVSDRSAGRRLDSIPRKNWDELFFHEPGMTPLTKEAADSWADAFESVRLAPSALNLQPWRIIRDEGGFHFYCKPSRPHRLMWKLLQRKNLQRIDIGIAMYHFELVAEANGQKGRWRSENPGIQGSGRIGNYVASWMV